MEITEQPLPLSIDQKESIKLMKMSKGYNWEVRIFITEDKATLERLARINNELRVQYGTD